MFMFFLIFFSVLKIKNKKSEHVAQYPRIPASYSYNLLILLFLYLKEYIYMIYVSDIGNIYDKLAKKSIIF